MMNPLKKYRQRKAQDRIAREIAERYGMLKEYEAALKGGFTPLEALDDWDMVTEEEKERLKEVVTNDRELTDSKFNRASTIISALALIFAIFASYFSYKATMKVSSKEYEMSQNMKYDLVEMVTVLRSIDNKASLLSYTDNNIDFTTEIQSLKSIQSKPGYLVFLSLIEERSERLRVENGMLLLSDYFLVSTNTQKTIIRAWVRGLLNIMEKYVDFDKSIEIDYSDVISKSCSKKTVLSKTDIDSLYLDNAFLVRDFVYELKLEGVADPEINYLDSVFHKIDSDNNLGDNLFKQWEYYNWKFMSVFDWKFLSRDSYDAYIKAKNMQWHSYKKEDFGDIGVSDFDIDF